MVGLEVGGLAPQRSYCRAGLGLLIVVSTGVQAMGG